MMDVFVTSLGLADKGGCTYCHIGPGQFDDDSKGPKNVARMMLGMVNDINAKFPDGKTHVTCFTCHRGSTTPRTITSYPRFGAPASPVSPSLAVSTM